MTRAGRFAGPLALLALAMGGAHPCRASDASIVDRILRSWVPEQGGIGNRPFVNSYAIQETVYLEGQVKMTMESRLVRTRAGHFRIELSLPQGGTKVIGFDGDVGWQARTSVGYSLMPVADDDPLVWQNDLLIGMRIVPTGTGREALKPEAIDGRECVVARVTVPGGPGVTCYFDRQTRRLVRIVKPPLPAARYGRTLTVDMGDYREVSGLSVPFLVRVDDGASVITHRRTKIEINPPVDEASFVLSTAQVQEAGQITRILQRQATTVGRPESFARIKSCVLELDVDSPTTGMRYAQTISERQPNLIVIETRMPGMGWEARGFDGKKGWFSSEIEGNRPLKQQELVQTALAGSLNEYGMIGSMCPYRRLIGDRTVGGERAEAVALGTDAGPAGTYYFDKGSGRLVRITAPTGGAGGEGENSIDFSDFRVVEGIEVPFVRVAESPELKTISKVRSVRFNVDLSDAVFEQRSAD